MQDRKLVEKNLKAVADANLARERVRDSESRYRLLAENMHDLVCLHDLSGVCVYVSPSSRILLGFAPEELVGASPFQLIHPDDAARVRREAHDRLLAGETNIMIECRVRNRTGEYRWLESMAQTVIDNAATVIQLQTVSRDITKRKHAEQELARTHEELARLYVSEYEQRKNADRLREEAELAREKAEAALRAAEFASRAKDEFLQMVSHEFRTPLTTIKTLTRVLQRDGVSAAKAKRYLENIAHECDRQIDMILNLLDVSRLEEGSVDLKQEPVDINRVLESCDRIERPATEQREQTFIVAQNPNLPRVRGDEKALRRALCTVIENSIKYTPVRGTIRVAVELLENQSDQIAVSVADDGRGILPEDLPHVFEKFYRGKNPHQAPTVDGTPDDAAGRAETPGVGLGLYLAKRLINQLGGRIEAKSEPGRGSTFTVFLFVWRKAVDRTDESDEYGFDEAELNR